LGRAALGTAVAAGAAVAFMNWLVGVREQL